MDAPDIALAVEHVEVMLGPRPARRETLARRKTSCIGNGRQFRLLKTSRN